MSTVSTEESRLYGDQAFPKYRGALTEASKALPTVLAQAAVAGTFSFAPLLEPAIVHEWTFKPGKRLCERWLKANQEPLKQEICSSTGLAAKFKREKDLILAVAALILVILGVAPIWGPVAGLLGVLVVRQIERICA